MSDGHAEESRERPRASHCTDDADEPTAGAPPTTSATVSPRTRDGFGNGESRADAGTAGAPHSRRWRRARGEGNRRRTAGRGGEDAANRAGDDSGDAAPD